MQLVTGGCSDRVVIQDAIDSYSETEWTDPVGLLMEKGACPRHCLLLPSHPVSQLPVPSQQHTCRRCSSCSSLTNDNTKYSPALWVFCLKIYRESFFLFTNYWTTLQMISWSTCDTFMVLKQEQVGTTSLNNSILSLIRMFIFHKCQVMNKSSVGTKEQ